MIVRLSGLGMECSYESIAPPCFPYTTIMNNCVCSDESGAYIDQAGVALPGQQIYSAAMGPIHTAGGFSLTSDTSVKTMAFIAGGALVLLLALRR